MRGKNDFVKFLHTKKCNVRETISYMDWNFQEMFQITLNLYKKKVSCNALSTKSNLTNDQ